MTDSSAPRAIAPLYTVLERSRELGFLGPGGIDEHVVHADGFARLTAEAVNLLDLGSGGGLPGLVIAVAHPELTLTLLDANERRVAFLRDSVRQLELGDRVSVRLGRAETLAREPALREAFDTVVARSFGAPAVTAECAAGFVAAGGRLLVSEPADAGDRWPEEGLARLGLAVERIHRTPSSTICQMRRVQAGLDEVPRRVGVPTRRPLF